MFNLFIIVKKALKSEFIMHYGLTPLLMLNTFQCCWVGGDAAPISTK